MGSAHLQVLDASRPVRAIDVPPVHGWDFQRRGRCCLNRRLLFLSLGHKRSLLFSTVEAHVSEIPYG